MSAPIKEEASISPVGQEAKDQGAGTTNQSPLGSRSPLVALLPYRPYTGGFRSRSWAVWVVARTAVGMMLRRKLFWGVYALGLLIFLMFFFGQYLLAFASSQMASAEVKVIGMPITAETMQKFLGNLDLDGKPETYRNFFGYQGWMLMILLALAGTMLIGNDFRFGSLSFYLSKPMSHWQYLLGKCLAVAVVVNLMTTVPALVLFLQYRFLYEWKDLGGELRLAAGIVAYGQMLTVVMGLMLLATASWLRRTVPLIMAWTTLFAFLRLLGSALVDGLKYDARWRLIDIWNDTYLVGVRLLDAPLGRRSTMQPAWYEAAAVLGALCLLCLIYLNRQVRAVEVVT